ncbi:MAG: histidine phosphatase family protein [Bacillota bacterium]
MGRIFLVRHGQTTWNKEEVFRGTLDIPLNDFGRKQAQEVGNKLKSLSLNDPLLISSPLGRALETAEIAGKAIFGKQVSIEQNFTDINFGEWQGKAKTEIEKLYPGLYRKWLTDPATIIFPGGESLEKVAARAKGTLYRLARDCKDHDLVIVSHRVVNKVLLCCLLGAGLNPFWKIKQDTACINILEYDGLSFFICVLNDTCHLLPFEQGDTTDF